MKRSQFRERLRELTEDPSELLAYFGLRRSLKEIGVNPLSDEGFIIVIAPAGYRAQPYKRAAYVILNVNREEWGAPRTAVRLAKSPKRKGSTDSGISLFDLQGLRVLIASHLNEVPKNVRFVASNIVFLKPPTGREINATRRMLRMPELTEEQQGVLIGKPEDVILMGLLKRAWLSSDNATFHEFENHNQGSPGLFDLPGFKEQKVWAQGLVKDIERWRQGSVEWKDVAQHALIAGPPGTGKTYFASALAAAFGFRLVKETVGAWQSTGYLNDMLAAMRRSFEVAGNLKGAVLFIDEFDSIGSRPVRPTGHSNETYWQVVINEFLSLMNAPGEGVIVIAATNYAEWIDVAILRAGRIEEHFELDLPDAATRAEILRHHANGAVDLESLSEISDDLVGWSPAQLEKLVKDARRKARNEDREMLLSDLRSLMPEKRNYAPEELFRLGVHEAGHALIALSLGTANAATIEIRDSYIPTEEFYPGGQTSYDLIESSLLTETDLLNRIAVSLAGMAAEAAVFSDRSVGSGGIAGSDVERATAIARRLVGSYGLGETPAFFGTPPEIADKNMPTPFEDEVLKILRTQYDRALQILASEKDRLIALAGDAAKHGKVRIERDAPPKAAP